MNGLDGLTAKTKRPGHPRDWGLIGVGMACRRAVRSWFDRLTMNGLDGLTAKTKRPGHPRDWGLPIGVGMACRRAVRSWFDWLTMNGLDGLTAKTKRPGHPKDWGLIGVGMACTSGSTFSAKRRRLLSAFSLGMPP